MKIKCLIHSIKDRSTPGKLLRFSDGSLKQVTQSGSLLNFVVDQTGKILKETKLNKKQRRALRRKPEAE